MGRAPAGGVEIGRIQPVDIHHMSGSGVDHALVTNSPIQGRSTAIRS
jgi:hypothetical protein